MTFFFLMATAVTVEREAFITLPNPTKEQIRRLNRQLGVDPDYAPASLNHSVRSYFHRPEVAPAVLRMDGRVRGALSERRYSIVAVVVSAQNRCGYCLASARRLFLRVTEDEELLSALVAGPAAAPLPADERAMVDFAVKLTRSPESMREQDLLPLRRAGFSDRDIFDLNLVVSWYNFMNRMACGLGYGPDAGHRFDPEAPLDVAGEERSSPTISPPLAPQ